MVETNGCADPNFCRGGCCRSFLGTEFCEVESNCVDNPTWLVILVPVALGVAAIVLLIITLLRLKNRKVISAHEQFTKTNYKQVSNNYGNNEQMGLNSDRRSDTERGIMK